MNKMLGCLLGVCMALSLFAKAEPRTIYARDYGIAPGKAFTAEDVTRMLDAVRGAPTLLAFDRGVYNIAEAQCQKRDWFISNHDQWNPRKVFLPLENMSDLTIHAEGARFELDGRIIFTGMWQCQTVTWQGGSVDTVTPTIVQIRFLEVDAAKKSVVFRVEGEGVKTEIVNGRLFVSGTGFRYAPNVGILFEPDKTMAYRTSDCGINLSKVTDLGYGIYRAENCAHRAFKKDQRMALRNYERPAPGIVLSDSNNISLQNLTIHFADGMALVAQSTADITLDGFSVIPNRDKGRFYSTQADATHFSGCWGKIDSRNGVYEGMMDDAINVHGTYLKVTKRLDDHTLEAAYQHHQTFGISWGATGDEVGFVRAATLDTEGQGTLQKVEILNPKTLRLTFNEALPKEIDPAIATFGLENRTRTPEINFSNNRVAYNRARGALFSSPRKTTCIGNTFDTVSGCAILLCGDCRGWFESGPCTDVLIKDNVFNNALTSPFQFTEAVVSIAPVIADKANQKRPFHSNVRIEHNTFIAFDKPLLFAESVDGLTFKNNIFTPSTAYAPYHWNKKWLTLRRCENVDTEPPNGLVEEK